MDNLINSVKQASINLAASLTPVLKESKFRETGRITPEEFVAAGDHITHHCPTWQWAVGDDSKLKSYLPKDKQFLISRNLPCSRRCKQMEFTGSETIVEDEEGQDGWVETSHNLDGAGESGESELNEKTCEMTLDSSKMEELMNQNEVADDEDGDDGDAIDMEDFEESGMLDQVDPSTATIPASAAPSQSETDTDQVLKTRSYDLHIVYDKYYQTPRLFLVGYSENRKPLSVEEMYEDISQDHAKKTVTMEPHPHLGPSMASIHPCRHADLMKKFIQMAEDGGRAQIDVCHILIIFLKFVQSVIPTIQYDFTQNFTM